MAERASRFAGSGETGWQHRLGGWRGRVGGRGDRATENGSLAPLVARLAVLLEAGVAPSQAWRHLASVAVSADERRRLAGVGEALARGEPGLDAFGLSKAAGDSDWGQLAAAWHVAETSGAPLAGCLHAFAEACRATTQSRREAEVALSGPTTTAKLVLALPAVGLLLGLVLGLNSLRILVGTPLGWACLISAALLVLIARAWNLRLVAGAAPGPAVPGLEFELLAVALAGGGSWPAARALVATALDACCPGLIQPATPEPTLAGAPAELESLARLSEASGCPAAALLRGAADEHRREARARAAAASARLGVLVLLPLGTCILPAFLLVGVVPLVAALLSSTAGAL